MVAVSLMDSTGAKKGSVELDDKMFNIEPNVGTMHQVVNAQLAAARAGTHNTKTRGEKRGGGAKPWRQKGTGRARQGSIRSPQWRGGGKAHGPKPRDYSQRTPKKMKRLALYSALSDRLNEEKLIVLSDWGFGDTPKTSEAVVKLKAVGATGKVLVVLNREDKVANMSFRNLPNVHLLYSDQLNPHDILVSDTLIFTEDALPTLPSKEPKPAEPVEKEPADKEPTETAAEESPAEESPAEESPTETADKEPKESAEE